MSDSYLGENLIFIISQPRSGSTLLQRVLSGHPDIRTSAETWMMLHPVYGRRASGIQAEYGADWALVALNEFLDNYTDGAGVYDNAIRAWAEVIYTNALQKSGGKIFIDKTPRYIFIIPDLYRLFPQARFIFLLRNPMAVLASELADHVKGNWPMLSVFSPDLLLAPRRILEGIELLGEAAITVHYEYFVQQPEESTEQLCRHLGVSFEPGMIEYGDTPAATGFMTDRVGIQQHSRPTPDSIDKWKRMLDNRQELHFAQSYLEALGREVIENMGYPYDELSNAIRVADGQSNGNGPVFPWDLAIRPPATWSWREGIYVRRYNRIREKGQVAGRLAALADLFTAGIRWLKFALRRT